MIRFYRQSFEIKLSLRGDSITCDVSVWHHPFSKQGQRKVNVLVPLAFQNDRLNSVIGSPPAWISNPVKAQGSA